MSRMHADYEALPDLLAEARRLALDFHDGLKERPVGARNPSMPPQKLPEDGGGALAALEEYQRIVAPQLSASAGPRYFGFVTGGATPASLAADWLVSAVDQNSPDPGDSVGPALSHRTIAMMADLFDLPYKIGGGKDGFDGTFTTGAIGANYLGAACFREWAGRLNGLEITRDGIGELLRPGTVEIFSASPHVTMVKALGVLGFGRKGYTDIAKLDGREAMDVAALDRALSASRARAKVVIASAGIVSTGDFEDLEAIADLCDKHQAWLHVDGAFGLFSRCSPRLSKLVKGVERADSITTDCHKWLNVPYDCGLFFTRHVDLLETAMLLAAPYLEMEGVVPSFINRTMESSQRLRSLPVWMSLKAYGRTGVREIVERTCDLAGEFGRRVDAMDGYELLAPVRLNIVIFRGLLGDDAASNAGQKALLDAINATGKVYVTPGLLHGKSGIRAAFSNWMTGPEDIDLFVEALNEGMAAARAKLKSVEEV
ncbi:pyridoxal phosphate-dependent decarboxylase family protein [Hwanghaeella sp.]|uniref:pyridoxal phosphate-dependent decarboxylase family protein n=1 Tax=Hwanghaeella sp. TaxID=2605943 RepID=UPI003CCC076B